MGEIHSFTYSARLVNAHYVLSAELNDLIPLLEDFNHFIWNIGKKSQLLQTQSIQEEVRQMGEGIKRGLQEEIQREPSIKEA